MRVYVAIPTYRNFGRTIGKTLEALAKQTYQNFKVLIVYKPFPGDRTLDVIDEFRDELDIEVVVQNEGYFEEAMNVIFDVSRDYDVVLTLDDDSIPNNRWIEQHLYMHRSLERLGLLGGLIEPPLPICGDVKKRLSVRLLAKELLGYYKPLYGIFDQFISYINDMGLNVCFNKNIIKLTKMNLKTLNQYLSYTLLALSAAYGLGGCNMSFKSKYVQGFRLPGVTFRGIGYERALVIHIIKQGGVTALFNGGRVIHLERSSLSRPKDVLGRFHRYLEEFIQPYLINMYEKINLQRLKAYYQFIKKYSYLKRTPLTIAERIGLSLAIQAIEEGWKPIRMRETIGRIMKEADKYLANH